MKSFKSLHINNLANKIDNSIEEFKFNVTIAHFYEIYKIFNKYILLEVSNNVLKKNLIKTMQLMMPFTPHLSYECLEKLECKNINKWPEILSNNSKEIKFAIQVNGKTRDIIDIKKDLDKEKVNDIVINKSKASKFLDSKKIQRTIFVKNKIINYIIK